MVLRLRISSSRLPLGLTTITVSPTFLLSRHAADGRGRGNFSRRDVGFFAGDQLVLHFLVLGAVEDLDGGTEAHFIVGDVVHVDHRQVGEALAQLADARLDELLALLGHVVLGVLAEVAERGGFLNLFGKLVNQLVLERVDLFLQFSFDGVCHSLIHSRTHSLWNYKPLGGWSGGAADGAVAAQFSRGTTTEGTEDTKGSACKSGPSAPNKQFTIMRLFGAVVPIRLRLHEKHL